MNKQNMARIQKFMWDLPFESDPIAQEVARLDGVPQTTIAEIYGVTKNRISFIERTALRKLRRALESWQ